MHHIFSALFLALPFSVVFGQSFSGPESVEVDYANNRYLVSNRGSVKSIQAVVPGQAPTLFTSNVTSPAGLEILGSKLWVCDGGRVKSFDLATGNLVNNINVGGTFLNGITSDGATYLFVSDFSAKKIYRINTLTETFNELVSNTVSTPNGLWYDGANNRILFVNWGSSAAIKAISMADSTVSTLTTTSLGNCDGIAADGNGNFFVSAWNSQSIHKFDAAFGAPVAVVSSLANPADICYNVNNDTLAVPNSQNNTVTFHYLGTQNNSVEELDNEFETIAYPNPASTDFTISSKANKKIDSIEIYDMNGRQADATIKFNDNLIAVSVSNLTAGTYFYHIQTEAGISRGKFVVE